MNYVIQIIEGDVDKALYESSWQNCTNLINIGRNLEMDYLCETQITNRLKEGVVLNQLLF
jgi:hypothetical protein